MYPCPFPYLAVVFPALFLDLYRRIDEIFFVLFIIVLSTDLGNKLL